MNHAFILIKYHHLRPMEILSKFFFLLIMNFYLYYKLYRIAHDDSGSDDSILETGGHVGIDFSITRFSQVNAASKSTSLNTYQLPEEIPSTSYDPVWKKAVPAAKPVKTTKPAEPKNPSKSKEDKAYEKALKAQDKANEKALKAAEAANKKANKLSDCLQVFFFFIILI